MDLLSLLSWTKGSQVNMNLMNSIRRNTISPLTLAMSTTQHNSAQTCSYFIPERYFLETLMLLSYNNQDHTFMGDYIIPVLNQQTRPLQHIWRPYLTQTFNNALTVATHISVKHLAAKIPSQLHNYFLPSYETSHIKVPFIHAAIKTIIKNFSISWFFSPLFTTT